MFEGKTLIGVGCSHVFGEYMKDYNPETCHERSWVKKLEKLGNFKTSVNLGSPGGSNLRSERVLFEYLKNNVTSDLVVIFSITELSRTELINNLDSINFYKIGSWMVSKEVTLNPRVQSFVETYYGSFHDDKNDVREINQRIFMIHSMLKLLNIEHYFFEMLCMPGTINTEQMDFKLPLISFFHIKGDVVNANAFLRQNGHPPGLCQHWDHAGNEFLAEHLLKQIKELKND
jgi:hypothetical protein